MENCDARLCSSYFEQMKYERAVSLAYDGMLHMLGKASTSRDVG